MAHAVHGDEGRQLRRPTPAGGSGLLGVAAASARTGWAVGCTGCDGSKPNTLMLRWNRTTWK
jgi:hypothetical protein